jgi:hypothetical protein
MGKLDDPFFGNISPDKTVKLVFSVSQDEDVRGPFPRSTLTTNHQDHKARVSGQERSVLALRRLPPSRPPEAA